MTTSSSHIMPTYVRFETDFVRGEGMYLFDQDGRRYLDCYAGIAVNGLGHCHPHLVKILQDQAQQLWHVSNLFTIGAQERLGQRLAASCFADYVFFCNSGVEANEGLIKLARGYQSHQGHPEKWRIITTKGAFHGRTLLTLAAANHGPYLEGFGPRIDGFDNVAFGDSDAVKAAITKETAAILIEPIQGDGGINVNSHAYLENLRKIADEHGLLLLMDEVQSGNGRTGKMWAHQWSNITPDAMATAKGIGGGFPLGAILATKKTASGMKPKSHGSTFGGNPLAVAVGNGVLDIIDNDDFLHQVRQTGDALKTCLEQKVAAYPNHFREVRGIGLMQGLVCQPDIAAQDMIMAFMAQGLLTVTAAQNVIRFLPPLIMTQAHINEASQSIDAALISEQKKAV